MDLDHPPYSMQAGHRLDGPGPLRICSASCWYSTPFEPFLLLQHKSLLYRCLLVLTVASSDASAVVDFRCAALLHGVGLGSLPDAKLCLERWNGLNAALTSARSSDDWRTLPPKRPHPGAEEAPQAN